MSIGPRIENRLQELGLSQAELARRIPVDQSTINGLIRGHSRSSKYLHRIARELETTAAYLAGETDDPTAEYPDERLDHREQDLIEQFRLLDREQQSAISFIVRNLARHAEPKATIHDERQLYRAEA